MPRKTHKLPGERESHEVLHDRIHAWWLAAVAGQVDQSHPIHGTNLTARVEADVLIIAGTVPSARDLQEIERETHHLVGHGVAHIRSELKVVPLTNDEPGLLAQTLLATYASAEQGGFAAGYLEGHGRLKTLLLRLVPPDDPAARAVLHAALPADFWRDAERALDGKRALLLVIVDELDAFKARELLEEETSSLSVRVLPPEPISAVESARVALQRDEAERPHASSGDSQGATARRRSRAAEHMIHER